jgi:hypothetical protein
MQNVLTDWTVVLAGSWNAAIFSPPWVSANVFGGDNVNLEMQFGPVPNLRYVHGRMVLIVQPESLIGAVREPTEEALGEISVALKRILDFLPHTPVTGLGINFGFREQDPGEELRANFNIADNARLIDLGGEVSQTSIQRDVLLDGGLLRLRETIEPNGSVHFHLNFHYDVESANAAAERLTANCVQRRVRALELMNAVYHLQPE